MTWALAWALPATLAVTACSAGSQAKPRATAPATAPAARQATPSQSQQPIVPPPSAAELKKRVLRLRDLPHGFVRRPLTSRNLPSHLTGCQRLGVLTGRGAGRHEQAEFFQPPAGPWLNEAVIAPVHRSAASLSGELAKAMGGCSSVTVTEEGQRVRLALAAAPGAPGVTIAAGDETHAYHATGWLGGIPLTMDIVVIRSGTLVLLLTNTSVAGTVDPALTAKAARAAAARAART
ncbi:MAG: hypothetical protein ACM3ML_07140 [Micromonosporaceae bacterium]